MPNFITAEQTKKMSTLSLTADDSLIRPYIVIAEKMYIVPVLGSAFAADLLDRLGSLTEKETVLLEMIQRSLAQYVLYEALPSVTYRLSQKGTTRPENGADLAEMKFLRSSIRDTAEQLRSLFIDFLGQNPDDFPGYVTPTGSDPLNPLRPESRTYGFNFTRRR